jgi:DNA-binding XRE family transcriptional regulator
MMVMTKEELKAWRKSRWLTQAELADALGVKKLAVSRWERGERGIPAFLRLALRSLETVKPIPKGKAGAKETYIPKPYTYSGLDYIGDVKEPGIGRPPKYPQPPSDALHWATVAISQLSRIEIDDPKREIAFEKVITWITKNRYGRKGESA